MEAEVILLQLMQKSGVASFRAAADALEEWLKQNQSDVFSSLCRGATEKQLLSLREKVFGGQKIPPLIEAWFLWHNGQKSDGPPVFPLYKHSPFYLATIPESIAMWRDMNAVEKHGEHRGPWSSNWLPILAGEFGDLLVIVTSGKGVGEVRAYWHESKRREVVAKDLVTLLSRIRKAHSSIEPKAKSKPDKTSVAIPVSIVKSSVHKCPKTPSREELNRDEIGTTYLSGPIQYYVYPFKAYYVAVKVGDNLWISVEEKSREVAMETIHEAVSKIRQSKWAHTSGEIWIELVRQSRLSKGKSRLE